MFFSCFSNIDVHDHYRQGSLAMEKNWNTQTWWHRLLGTLFGMICTDAFLGYRLEFRNRQMGGEVGILSYKDFLHRLAYQLIHNNGIRPRLRRRQREVEVEEEVVVPVNVSYCKSIPQYRFLFSHLTRQNILGSSLLPLRGLPAYNGLGANMRAKRRCCMGDCNLQSSYYYVTCSDVNNDRRIVSVCNPHNKPHSMCFNAHIALNLNAYQKSN
jgi:hypothetical protein